MKILHLVESFASGTRQIVKSLANHQARAGHDVHIWHGTNAYTPDSAMDGFDSEVQSWAVPCWGSRKLNELLSASCAIFSQRRKRFDVVHLHSSVAGVMGRVLLSRVGRLTVYTPHGSAFLQTQRPRWWHTAIWVVEILAYRFCSSPTVACSESELVQIKHHLPNIQVLVIPNGCDEVASRILPGRKKSAEKGLSAVAIGRISVQKNFEELSVLRPLYDQGLSLTVIGGGEPEQEAQLESLGLSITGWKNSAQVNCLLSESDLLLVSSLWEGMPLAVIEAMSLGIPVVARNAPGVVDLVEHGLTGFLYTNTDELYLNVQKLLCSPELLLRLGGCARQKYLAFHQSESMCRAYDNLYRTYVA